MTTVNIPTFLKVWLDSKGDNRTQAVHDMIREYKKIIPTAAVNRKPIQFSVSHRDLDEIYQLWTNLVNSDTSKPNIVIAIQKEMFRDHFFLDKMEKIEIQPLPPEKMLEAYIKKFGSTYPFTEDALQTISRMSRGIFRRYLRYINLTLDSWLNKQKRRTPINTETVTKAVTYKKMVDNLGGPEEGKEPYSIIPKPEEEPAGIFGGGGVL